MNFSSNKKNATITFDRRLFDEKVCKLLDVGGCGEDEYDKNYQPAPSAILSLIEASILNEREQTKKIYNQLRFEYDNPELSKCKIFGPRGDSQDS